MVPAEYDFPNLDLFREPGGLMLLKDILPKVFSDEFRFLDRAVNPRS